MELRMKHAGSEWVVTVTPEREVVWWHFFAGPMSGGTFITAAEARIFASMLNNAADEVEGKTEKAA